MSILHDLLRKRYAAPAWALVEEVRNEAGHDATRSADAMAVSLWKSHGLEVHGFEIKAHRSDWLRELKDPAKAETFARFCDRWWIVAAKGVVLDGELPAGWGLLVARGSALAVEVKAPKLEAEVMSRALLSNMMRRATEELARRKTPEEFDAAVTAEVERVIERRLRVEISNAQQLAERDALLSKVEAALGVHRIYGDYQLPNIAEALKLVTTPRGADYDRACDRLAEQACELQRVADEIAKRAASMRALKGAA